MKKLEFSETKESQMSAFETFAKDIVCGQRVIIVINDEKFSLLPTYVESKVTKLLENKYGYTSKLKTAKLSEVFFDEKTTDKDVILNQIIFCKENIFDNFSQKFNISPSDVYYI